MNPSNGVFSGEIGTMLQHSGEREETRSRQGCATGSDDVRSPSGNKVDWYPSCDLVRLNPTVFPANRALSRPNSRFTWKP